MLGLDQMLRLRIRAGFAVFASLVMCLSAPTVSLAHGNVHHELGEYLAETHHAPAVESLVTIPEYVAGEGHGHPVVQPSVPSRLALALTALISRQVTLRDLEVVRTIASVVPAVSSESPQDPVSTRPQQPRAPPVL